MNVKVKSTRDMKSVLETLHKASFSMSITSVHTIESVIDSKNNMLLTAKTAKLYREVPSSEESDDSITQLDHVNEAD
jgi:hypothetical protein